MEEVPGSADLAASMAVQVLDDRVRLRLDVTNASGHPIELEFSSTQQIDFAVRDAAGEDLWRWSADRSFAQMLTADTILAGESRSWEAEWEPGGRTGAFVAMGWLLAAGRDIALETEFEMPPD